MACFPRRDKHVRQWLYGLRRMSTCGVIVALMLPAAGWALASGSVTDLGRPTNTLVLSPEPSLGAFHRAGTSLHQHGKPELLFIGTQVDDSSAVQRWPVVKALNQFGSFSSVRAMSSRACSIDIPGNRIDCSVAGNHGRPGPPTFDWQSARYSSHFLAFVHKDVIDDRLRMRQTLSPQERALFNRYVRVPGFTSWHDAVWNTAVNLGANPSRSFPLVMVGGYLETGNNVVKLNDFEPKTLDVYLPFDAVQRALQRGTAIGDVPSSLPADVNAEANIMTTLICHADGMRPAKVCGRSVILEILRHVK